MKRSVSSVSLLLLAAPAIGQTITRASVSGSGAEGDGPSGLVPNSFSTAPAISADGRFVAFVSTATNLVNGDTNGSDDVFLKDLQTGTVERVSIGTGDAQGLGGSGMAGVAISADGRFVAFDSTAVNFSPSDTNGEHDIYLRDRLMGTTALVSVDSSENQGQAASAYPAISANGRFVAFVSWADNLCQGDGNGFGDIVLRDLVGGTTTLVSVSTAGAQTNAESLFPWVSATGRYVGFASNASTLVAGVPLGSFVRDRIQGTTECVSTDANGVAGNALSGGCVLSSDGKYAFFRSMATNLVPGVTGGLWQVYRKNRRNGAIECLSVSTQGLVGNGGTTIAPAVSEDGRYVVFDSRASNLVPGDANEALDIFVRDCVAGTTTRISSSAAGQSVRGDSTRPTTSRDGRYVTFCSLSKALVPPDTNGCSDVFVWDRGS